MKYTIGKKCVKSTRNGLKGKRLSFSPYYFFNFVCVSVWSVITSYTMAFFSFSVILHMLMPNEDHAVFHIFRHFHFFSADIKYYSLSSTFFFTKQQKRRRILSAINLLHQKPNDFLSSRFSPLFNERKKQNITSLLMHDVRDRNRNK